MKTFRPGIQFKFQCSCGKRILVSASRPSGVCPKCKTFLTIPNLTPSLSSSTISIKCSCTATFSATNDFCPECNQTLYEKRASSSHNYLKLATFGGMAFCFLIFLFFVQFSSQSTQKNLVIEREISSANPTLSSDSKGAPTKKNSVDLETLLVSEMGSKMIVNKEANKESVALSVVEEEVGFEILSNNSFSKESSEEEEMKSLTGGLIHSGTNKKIVPSSSLIFQASASSLVRLNGSKEELKGREGKKKVSQKKRKKVFKEKSEN